jgi:hypothetical protein
VQLQNLLANQVTPAVTQGLERHTVHRGYPVMGIQPHDARIELLKLVL